MKKFVAMPFVALALIAGSVFATPPPPAEAAPNCWTYSGGTYCEEYRSVKSICKSTVKIPRWGWTQGFGAVFNYLTQSWTNAVKWTWGIVGWSTAIHLQACWRVELVKCTSSVRFNPCM